MMDDKHKIGIREMTSILILSISFKLSNVFPNLIFGETYTASWMIPIISAIIFLPSFLILNFIMSKYKDKDLMEVLSCLIGKMGSFIMSFVFLLIIVIGTSLSVRNDIDALTSVFYPKTPSVFLYTILMLSSYYLAKHGIRIIGAYAWIFAVAVKVVMFFILVIAFKDINTSHIFPILGSGIGNILKESVIHTSLYGELILYTCLYSFVRSPKEYTISNISALIISMVEISIFIAFYLMIFDYITITANPFAFHELTKTIRVGSIFTNVESFFLGFWIIAAIIRYAIYVFVITHIFTSICNLKNKSASLLGLTLLIIVIGQLPKDPSETINFLRYQFLNYVWIIFILFPYILFIVYKWKEHPKYEKH